MKISTVRRTDGLGRVVLPEELRSALGLGEGASVRLTLEGRRVILEKKGPSASCAAALKTCIRRAKARSARSVSSRLPRWRRFKGGGLCRSFKKGGRKPALKGSAK